MKENQRLSRAHDVIVSIESYRELYDTLDYQWMADRGHTLSELKNTITRDMRAAASDQGWAPDEGRVRYLLVRAPSGDPAARYEWYWMDGGPRITRRPARKAPPDLPRLRRHAWSLPLQA